MFLGRSATNKLPSLSVLWEFLKKSFYPSKYIIEKCCHVLNYVHDAGEDKVWRIFCHSRQYPSTWLWPETCASMQHADHSASIPWPLSQPSPLHWHGNHVTCMCMWHTHYMADWLLSTDVRLDGDLCVGELGFDNYRDYNDRDYPCILEDDTAGEVAQRDSYLRHCTGLGFLCWCSCYWPMWRGGSGHTSRTVGVLRRLRLPWRRDFTHDALFVHADADLELAMGLRRCVEEAAEIGGMTGLALKSLIEIIPVPSVYAE